MRKTVLLLCFLFCLCSIQIPHASAHLVEISEVSGWRFLQNFSAYKAPIGKIRTLKYDEDTPYPTAVMAGLGEDGHGAIITVFENGAGYASKAVVLYRMSDNVSMHRGVQLVVATFLRMGVTAEELKVLQNIRRESEYATYGVADVWCKKANRRIVHEVYMIPQEDSIMSRIIAYDN